MHNSDGALFLLERLCCCGVGSSFVGELVDGGFDLLSTLFEA